MSSALVVFGSPLAVEAAVKATLVLGHNLFRSKPPVLAHAAVVIRHWKSRSVEHAFGSLPGARKSPGWSTEVGPGWFARKTSGQRMEVTRLVQGSRSSTLSTVRSGPMRTEVRTEPNPQVLGSVLCEGGPDPYLQVRGPSLSGPDLGVEPGSDLVRTSRTGEVTLADASRCHICHITQRRPQHGNNSCSCSCQHRQRRQRRPQLHLQLPPPTRTTTTTAAPAAATLDENDDDHSCTCSCHRQRGRRQ